jgi:hypothetical protein
MTEPPTSSPDPAAPGERDELLGTKVNIPRPRPDRPARSQLFQRLDEGIAQALILVCAPAGFGKTTLLTDWATSASCPVAWLSLDEGDNDPARSWRYVVAALDRAREGLGEQLLPLLTVLTPLSGQGVVTALISRPEAQPEELALYVAPIRRRYRPRSRGLTISPMIACILTCQPENPRSACALAWIRPESTYKDRVGHRHASADPLVLCR